MASLFHWPSAPQLWGSVTSYVSPRTPSPKPPTASSTIDPPRLVMARVSDGIVAPAPRAMALKPTPTPAPSAPPAAPVSVSLMIVSPLNSPSPRWRPASRPSRAAPDAAPDAAPIAAPMRIVPTGPNAPAVATVATTATTAIATTAMFCHCGPVLRSRMSLNASIEIGALPDGSKRLIGSLAAYVYGEAPPAFPGFGDSGSAARNCRVAGSYGRLPSHTRPSASTP